VSYWLEDADEKYLGDFATNFGIIELGESGPEPLREFLQAGRADAELMQRVIEATKDDPDLRYIAKMLRKAKPPVIVTDGT